MCVQLGSVNWMASYSGSGESIKEPIVVSDVRTHFEAVDAEYAYLAQRFGKKGIDWKLVMQSLLGADGKQIDKMDIELANGERMTLFFDITKYFGVFEAPDTSGQGKTRRKKMTQ